jgi:predicted nucleic acid-binding protein
MARYAIDAPTLLYLVDEHATVHPSHQLVAPNSIRSEALQLLLRDVREGNRTEADALTCHEQLTQQKMRLLGDRVSRRTAWRIARERDWESLRDAEYLAVAVLQADAFVTVDRGIVAKAEGLVRVASVSELGLEG